MLRVVVLTAQEHRTELCLDCVSSVILQPLSTPPTGGADPAVWQYCSLLLSLSFGADEVVDDERLHAAEKGSWFA